MPNLTLPNFRELELTANKLEELPNGLQDAKLETLKVSENQLSSLNISKEYDHLETIICSNNPLSIIHFGQGINKIKKVVLDWIPMSTSDLDGLPLSITILSLEHCDISNIESLNRLENLKELSLIGNHLTTDEINKLKLPKLTNIWLSQNNLNNDKINLATAKVIQD